MGKGFVLCAIFVLGLSLAECMHKYMGCYNDRGDRAMKGFENKNMPHLTNEICIRTCKNKGHRYAATQYSRECFCGNNYARHGKATRESDCNKQCSGNAEENCGGTWKMSVYSTEDYLGCYRDAPARALTGKEWKGIPNMSTDKCLLWCRARKFPFAATQYSTECFCGDSFDKYGPVPEAECNKPCSGDHKDTCGGTWRMSVYSTERYLGCYRDAHSRALAGKNWKHVANMSPQMCVSRCRALGLPYAGTEHSNECFCGNGYNRYGRMHDAKCNKACSGERSIMCGGSWRMSVYSTVTYIGCYVDKQHRALSGPFEKGIGDLTTIRCIETCKHEGYLYAGTEYANECFCGDSYTKYRPAPEAECNKRCSGNPNEMCGGTWRVSVYSTGLDYIIDS